MNEVRLGSDNASAAFGRPATHDYPAASKGNMPLAKSSSVVGSRRPCHHSLSNHPRLTSRLIKCCCMLTRECHSPRDNAKSHSNHYAHSRSPYSGLHNVCNGLSNGALLIAFQDMLEDLKECERGCIVQQALALEEHRQDLRTPTCRTRTSTSHGSQREVGPSVLTSFSSWPTRLPARLCSQASHASRGWLHLCGTQTLSGTHTSVDDCKQTSYFHARLHMPYRLSASTTPCRRQDDSDLFVRTPVRKTAATEAASVDAITAPKRAT